MCAHCASAKIQRTSHSGQLGDVPITPGKLHLDFRGPLANSINGEKYACIAVDEYSRYVFVRFAKSQSDFARCVKEIVAEFNATVGMPVNEGGEPLQRPTVYELRHDNDSNLLSRDFRAFRADSGVHATFSPPYDHDLNPLAERLIGVISDQACASAKACGAPVGFWPYFVRDAVLKHNCIAGSVGTSTADDAMCPYQRLRLRQPHLCTAGCRAVVAIPPPERRKSDPFGGKGYTGIFLTRSAEQQDCFDIRCPELSKVIPSSSMLVDEEWFPWLGKNAYQPLRASTRAQMTDTAPAPTTGGETNGSGSGGTAFKHANTQLHALNLFSGPYGRSDGLTACLQKQFNKAWGATVGTPRARRGHPSAGPARGPAALPSAEIDQAHRRGPTGDCGGPSTGRLFERWPVLRPSRTFKRRQPAARPRILHTRRHDRDERARCRALVRAA